MTRYLHADWPAHARVRTLVTTRVGGVSEAPWATLNLGLNCGDSESAVYENRRRLQLALPSEPAWLKQVHGCHVVSWEQARAGREADAVISNRAEQVCAILTADCLPVLLADMDGRVVAAVHAGWRGLAAGIIGGTVNSMSVQPSRLMAWMGPAISQNNYQVGNEVRDAFIANSALAKRAFIVDGDRWRADLYELARQQLLAAGVGSVHGGNFCTFGQAASFYSYRRDGQTGRMASTVWLAAD